jgi:subtilisin family serine protease
VRAPERKLPAAVADYATVRGAQPFALAAACRAWAGYPNDSGRRRRQKGEPATASPSQFIVFPAAGVAIERLADRLRARGDVTVVSTDRTTVVADFGQQRAAEDVLATLRDAAIGYAEPDCDGPEFATTAAAPPRPALAAGGAHCWQRSATRDFPNDPCLSELWGHTSIGWDAEVAARSLPRLVAVIDSGIDAYHEDLAGAVTAATPRASAAAMLVSIEAMRDARCAGHGGCYPHGTQMAGTIAGRMNNGVGLAGVAPNSQLLPIRIAQVEHGNLMRLSTIARAIELAAESGANVINVSAKWPVDSRAVREAVERATGANSPKRLLVTGYTTSFSWDEQVVEGFPSRYRHLPGVIAAVPGDAQAAAFAGQVFHSANPQDGRIMAPGVDIVVTTTQNPSERYALSQAAGASSAAAYISGAIALIWGTRPLDTCSAREIKRLLFCGSKSAPQSKYPWVHVEFLHQLAELPPRATCADAMSALRCPN